jgi:uncharacterized protein YnzC (UPF0291/DUF896 family)
MTSNLSDTDLIKLIDEEGQDLSDWEVEFISDMVDKHKGHGLTDAQRAKLEEIAEARL